jgi:hypothetical protein
MSFSRKLDVDGAESLLVETLRWRQEVKIDELMKRRSQRVFSAVPFGCDRMGRPVLYVISPDTVASKSLTLPRTATANSDRLITRERFGMMKSVAYCEYLY